MHYFYWKSSLRYGNCKKKESLPIFLVEILGNNASKFRLKRGSQLPYICLMGYIQDFYCEGRLMWGL